jgi:branched-chain amino acid transport system permease protein
MRSGMRTDLRQRYDEDLALVRGTAGWLAALGLAVALLLFPLYAPGYLLFTAVLAATHVIVAVGLTLLTGYTGQISLGHAAFVAIGAYTTGVLGRDVPALPGLAGGLPWWVTWPLAGLVAAGFGALVGLPALRLTGPYLTIATLGFGIAVNQVLTNWETLSGGRMGLPIPRATLGLGGLSPDRQLAYLALGTAALLVWVAVNLARSHVGRAFVAIRDSDIAAEVMGVHLTRYKTLAFAVSAFYAGVGGALFAQALRHIEPQMFTLFESIYYFAMIVVGGLVTIPGAVVGAVVLTLVPQWLTAAREWQPVVYGAAIILMMAVEPQGLYGRWLRIRAYLKTWPL